MRYSDLEDGSNLKGAKKGFALNCKGHYARGAITAVVQRGKEGERSCEAIDHHARRIAPGMCGPLREIL